jgi:hypothetical protein
LFVPLPNSRKWAENGYREQPHQKKCHLHTYPLDPGI